MVEGVDDEDFSVEFGWVMVYYLEESMPSGWVSEKLSLNGKRLSSSPDWMWQKDKQHNLIYNGKFVHGDRR